MLELSLLLPLLLAMVVDRRFSDEDDEYVDEGRVGSRWGSSGSGLLFTTGRRIFLVLRSGRVDDPYTWGIPGGAVPVRGDGRRMDPQESALVECREEIGGVPALSSRVAVVTFQGEGGFTYTTFVHRVSEAAADAFSPELNWESDDCGWFDVEEVRRLELHPGVEYVLEQAGGVIFER